MVSSKLFMNNTTQAVRLPKGVAFPDNVTEVEVIIQGSARLLVPSGTGWTHWAKTAPRLPDDVTLDKAEIPALTDDVRWFDE